MGPKELKEQKKQLSLTTGYFYSSGVYKAMLLHENTKVQ